MKKLKSVVATVLGAVTLFLMSAASNGYAAFDGLLPRMPNPPLPEGELNSWRFDDAGWTTNVRTANLFPLLHESGGEGQGEEAS